MDDEGPKTAASGDGRPVDVREGREPQPDDEAEEDIPDPGTVESIGY